MVQKVSWGLTAFRVWTAELPDWEASPDGITEITLAAPKVDNAQVREIAVECRRVPGRALYEALGATFTPGDTGQIVVRIPYTIHNGRVLEGSLALSDEVHIRLDKEYVEGVLVGVRESDAIPTLGSGTLTFSHAAHGLIGSSRAGFRRASRCLLRLLAWDNPNPSEYELEALLRDELRRIPSDYPRL